MSSNDPPSSDWEERDNPSRSRRSTASLGHRSDSGYASSGNKRALPKNNRKPPSINNKTDRMIASLTVAQTSADAGKSLGVRRVTIIPLEEKEVGFRGSVEGKAKRRRGGSADSEDEEAGFASWSGSGSKKGRSKKKARPKDPAGGPGGRTGVIGERFKKLGSSRGEGTERDEANDSDLRIETRQSPSGKTKTIVKDLSAIYESQGVDSSAEPDWLRTLKPNLEEEISRSERSMMSYETPEWLAKCLYDPPSPHDRRSKHQLDDREQSPSTFSDAYSLSTLNGLPPSSRPFSAPGRASPPISLNYEPPPTSFYQDQVSRRPKRPSPPDDDHRLPLWDHTYSDRQKSPEEDSHFEELSQLNRSPKSTASFGVSYPTSRQQDYPQPFSQPNTLSWDRDEFEQASILNEFRRSGNSFSLPVSPISSLAELSQNSFTERPSFDDRNTRVGFSFSSPAPYSQRQLPPPPPSIPTHQGRVSAVVQPIYRPNHSLSTSDQTSAPVFRQAILSGGPLYRQSFHPLPRSSQPSSQLPSSQQQPSPSPMSISDSSQDHERTLSPLPSSENIVSSQQPPYRPLTPNWLIASLQHAASDALAPPSSPAFGFPFSKPPFRNRYEPPLVPGFGIRQTVRTLSPLYEEENNENFDMSASRDETGDENSFGLENVVKETVGGSRTWFVGTQDSGGGEKMDDEMSLESIQGEEIGGGSAFDIWEDPVEG